MRCDEILANSIIFDTTQQPRTAWRYGLGERLNGIQEVSGSIPLISTKTFKEKTFYFNSLQFLKRVFLFL